MAFWRVETMWFRLPLEGSSEVRALGSNATALVNVINALAEGRAKFVPDILVTGGSNGGALDGLAATAMRYLGNGKSSAEPP